ncbi:MAG: DUF2341 domain-containing protein, partial [Candidatus Omnitrophica bacterium]|nr:DUF2341 domain-containing protein [Candidatus Omnitrophota bacterium]
MRRALGLYILFILSILLYRPLFAQVVVDNVESGTVTVQQQDPATINITASDAAVINFRSFSIAANERVNFIQPSVNATVLNRVTGPSVSQIFGTLEANGVLFIVNPNGIHFGPGAQVTANSLVASTLDISTNNFINKNYVFENNRNPAQILNEGNITVENSAALMAGSVDNKSVIIAKVGTVHLASGDKTTVSFDRRGLINVEVDAETDSKVVGIDGVTVKDAIANSGTIEGNQIVMTAKTAQGIFENCVNNSGTVKAKRIENVGGVIRITATGTVKISGTMEAEGVSIDANAPHIDRVSDSGGPIITVIKTIEPIIGLIGPIDIGQLNLPQTDQNQSEEPETKVEPSDFYPISVYSADDIIINQGFSRKGDTKFSSNKNIFVNTDVGVDSGNLEFIADADLDGIGSFRQAKGTTISTTNFGHILIQSSGQGYLANIISAGDLILRMGGAAAIFNQWADSTVIIQGSFIKEEGVTLNAGNTVYRIGKDWLGPGIFVPDKSTVQFFSDITANIRGPTIFYNLIIDAPDKIVRFDSGQTYTVLGNLTLRGSYGNLLTLTSLTPSQQWRILPLGNSDIAYTQLGDCFNARGPPLKAIHSSSLGNNTNLDLDPFWTGNGTTNNWSDPDNWDTGTTPTAFDTVTFDGITGLNPNKNSFIDPLFQGSLDNFIINGYTGVITLGRDLTISGNFNHQTGTFNPATYTVSFIDASKSSYISGNNTFYNLKCVTPGKTLVFEANTLTTVNGTLTIEGSADNYVTLTSSVASKNSKFRIYIHGISNAAGDPYVQYLTVTYSAALGPLVPILAHNKNVRGELNTGWDATYTWTGTTDGSWSNADNWGGSAPSSSGDDLVFPVGASNKSTNNNFVGYSFASITFDDSGYTLAGNSIILTGSITDNASPGGNAISLGMELSGSVTVTVASGETLAISSVISGTGSLTKSGAGKVTLSPGSSVCSAVSFDGSSGNYVGVADDASLSGMTDLSVSAWVYIVGDGISNGVIIIKQGTGDEGNASYGLLYLVGPDKITFSLNVGGWADHETTSTFSPNTWYLVTATYDGDTGDGNIYINGNETPDSTFNISGGGPVAATTSSLMIGREDTWIEETFNGKIAETAVWNRTLAASEVSVLYNSGSGVYGSTSTAPFNSGLVAGWNFNENAGTEAADFSGYGRTGTLNGAVAWTTGVVVVASSNSYTGGTTINAGTLNFANTTLSSSGNITFAGGTLQYAAGNTQDISGRIKNSTAGAIIIDTNGNDVSFASAIDSSNTAGLTKQGTGTLTLSAANTYIGTTSVAAGTLTAANSDALGASSMTLDGGILATSGITTLNIAGDWTRNSGSFTYGTSIVKFTGTNQIISGSTTFYSLTKDVSADAARTLTFTSGTTQTIASGGTLTLTGATGKVLSLRSSSAGTQYNITVNGSSAVTYVDVKDSNAGAGYTIPAGYSVDSGNNSNWMISPGEITAVKVWKGGTSTAWATDANWKLQDGSATVAPIPTDGVKIDATYSNAPTLSAQATIASLLMSGASVLTLNVANTTQASPALTVSGNVDISGTSNITHTANSTTALGDKYEITMSVGGNFTLGATATINVVGKGYTYGNGPGKPGSGGYAGGSYGGLGGVYVASNGPVYGSIIAPVNIGSGGYDDRSSSGGGAIILSVTGASSISGTISASGSATTSYTWGGSGGSIYITTGTISGAGALQADGGYGIAGGGGGGRISVVLTGTDADFLSYSGNTTAYGGGAGGSYPTSAGAAGTVYKETKAQTGGNGTLTIDNNNLTTTSTVTTSISSAITGLPTGSITVQNKGKLEIGNTVILNPGANTVTINTSGLIQIDSGGTLNLTGGTLTGDANTAILKLNGGTLTTSTTFSYTNINLWLAVDSTFNPTALFTVGSGALFTSDVAHTFSGGLTIASGGTMTHTTNAATEAYKIDLTIGGDFTVTGTINVDGKGYAIDKGPGARTTGNPGATYGGMGGPYAGSAAVAPYGSITAPENLGSGSDRDTGGGAVILDVTGATSITGSIYARSGSGVSITASGGSIYLITGTLTGNGIINANAKDATVGGGGGRVSIKLIGISGQPADFTGFSGTITAYGGSGTYDGAAGTVYKETTAQTGGNGDLIIDNYNTATAAGIVTSISASVTEASVGTVTLSNRGMLTIDAGQTLTIKGSVAALTVNVNSTLVNNGTLQLTGDGVTNSGTVIIGSGSTVEYTATSGSRDMQNWSYQNLKINGNGGTFTFSAASLTVAGNFALSAGIFTAPSGTFTVSGNWEQTGGTFTPGLNTVTFDASGTQTLASGGTSFNNIIHSGAGTLRLVTSALVVGGTFVNSAGTFDADTNDLAFTSTGLTTVSGGTFTASSSATMTFNAGLTISGGTFTGSTGSVDVNGDFTLSAGTFTAPSTMTVSGNWDDCGGTFSANSGTVDFDNATDKTFTTLGGQTYNNITHSGASALTISMWQYRRLITIDYTKVSADVTDFPLLVSLTGLSHINPNGTDIRFTTSDGKTGLAREIESYNSGTLVAWVKTNLSASIDTTIYMYYGNSSATTEPDAASTYGKNNVWTADYRMVLHMNDNAANTTVSNSTSNSISGTNAANTSTKTIAGQVGNALNYNGSSDSTTVTNGYTNTIQGDNTFTFSFWAIANSYTGNPVVIDTPGLSSYGLFMEYSTSATGYWWGTGGSYRGYGNTTMAAGLNYFTFVKTAATAGTFYLNGVAQTPNYGSLATSENTNSDLILGAYRGPSVRLNGIIDEVRISNTTHESTWITTEYRNQSLQGAGVGKFISSSGTETANAFTVGGALTQSGAGTMSLPSPANTNVTGNVGVSAGTLNLNGSNFSVTGTFTVSDGATLQLKGDETAVGGGALPTPTLNSGSTVEYTATSGTRAIQTWSYQNLKINGTGGTFTLSANTSVAGNLNLSAGTLDLSTFTADRTTAGGTLTLGASTVLNIGGTGTLPANYSTHSINASSTVNYNGTTQSVATLNSAQNYGNLTISGSSTKTLAGNTTVSGTLTVSAGTLDANTKTMTVTGLTTVSGGTYSASTAAQTFNGGLTVSGTGTFTGSSGTVDVNGDFTFSGGTFTAPSGTMFVSGALTHSGGTWDANGGSVVLENTSDKALTLTAATTFNHLYINDGLVGYWKFDEAVAGPAVDSSGYGNTGTNNGPATITSATNPVHFTDGKLLSFDGTDDYVNCGAGASLDITGAITISGWFNSSLLSGVRIIADKYQDAIGGYQLYTNGNKLEGYILGPGGAFGTTGTTVLSTGAWYHAAVIFIPSTGIYLYLNGNLEASKIISPPSSISSTARSLNIGAENGTNYLFNGLIDDVRIYNRALSAQEIQALAAGNQPATSIATTTVTGGDLDVNGNLVLNAGTLNTGTRDITVAGNWENNGGKFTPGAKTVTMDGTSGSNIILSGGQKFNNLYISGSGGTWNLSDRLNVNSSPSTPSELKITAGTLDVRGNVGITNYDYTIHASKWTQTGGTFTCRSGIVVLDSIVDATFTPNSTFNILRIEDPSESGLVGYWKFDEENGTIAFDSSGNSNTGTLTNTPSRSYSPASTIVFDNPESLSFDGTTGQKLILSSPISLGSEATIATWIKWNSLSGHLEWIGLSTDVGGYFYIEPTTTTTFNVRFNAASANVTFTVPTMTAGQWYNLAVTSSGGTTRLYLNGAESSSGGQAQTFSGVSVDTFGRYSGYNLPSSIYDLNGSLDDVRIYNRALSTTEVANLAAGKYAAGNSSTATQTLGGNLSTATLALDSGNISTSTFDTTITNALTIASGNGAFTAGSGTTTLNGGLTISGGTFTASSGNVDVNNTLTLSSGTLTAPSSSGTFKISADFTITSGAGTTFNHNSGTVIFDGTSILTSGGKTFNNIQVGSSSAQGSLTLADSLDLDGGVAGGTGSSSDALDISNRTVNVGGNFNLNSIESFTSTGSTVIFDGGGTTQNLSGNSKIFNNITIGTNTAGASVTLLNTLDMIGALTFNNSFGAASLDSSSQTVKYSGAALDLTNASTFTATGSTWIFYGTVSLTSAGKTFNNVQAGSSTSSGSLTLADGIDINGSLAGGAGGTNTLDISNRAVNIAGNLNFNKINTFTSAGSTVTFDGGVGVTQTLNSNGKSFNNIEHSGTGTLQLTTNSLNVTGTLTNSNGIFDASTNNIAVTVTGLTTVSGGTYQSGSGAQAFNGGLTIQNSPTFTGSATVQGALTVDPGATFAPTSSTITMSGAGWSIVNNNSLTFNSLTIATTPTTQPASSFSIGGALTVNNGVTLAPTAGTITMNDGSSIVNSGALTFNNLAIANS